VQECFGGGIDELETLRRASQWLQYEGLRYAVEATLRRGCGTIPWQFNESFPNAWCTCAVDWHAEPKPAYWGVRRAYGGAPRARFETWAWGGRDEVRAQVTAPARLVDLDGRVVAEGEQEVAAPLAAFAHDVFVLDLGTNRYVLTRTEDLSPLLDLPRTTLELAGGVLRNTGAVAAIGVILEADDRWAAFEDNVLDLLPGEARAAGPATRAEGWNARV
jgi:beta-mannosidase